MVVLMQHWAERYMQLHKNISVQVSGGGTGTGFAALANGTADIATASRSIHASETEQLLKHRQAPIETAVAVDALAVYVQRNNPLKSLTLSQLKRVFRGHIHTWRALDVELPQDDDAIVLYSRENSSGTYEFFKAHVLDDEDLATHAQTLPGTAAVINAVQRDRRGIGYGGLAYGHGVHAIALEDAHGVLHEPSQQEALQGSYPLARKLFLYTSGTARQTVRDFVAWTRTPMAQEVVAQTGFFPLQS